MNRYETKTPRAALAIAALALSLTTMGVLVGAPAAVQVDPATLTTTARSMPTIRIEVVAKREAPLKVASANTPHVDR